MNVSVGSSPTRVDELAAGLSTGLHGGSGESICHSVPAACLGPAYLR